MKNLCLLFICCLLFVGCSCAQTLDLKIAAKVAELHKAGVDTIITYHPYCVGSVMVIDGTDTAKCHPNNKHYLFWIIKGSTYVQRFDECYNHSLINGKSAAIIQLIKLHFVSLKRENIKPVEFQEKIRGKLQTFTTSIDHSCHADFEFYIGRNKIFKGIDDYDLNTQFINFDRSKAKNLNLNYAYNQHTYLKRLKDLFEKEISILNFTKAN